MKNRVIWILVFVGLSTASLLWFLSNRGATVSVEAVKKGDIKKCVEEIGIIKSKDSKMVSIEGSGLIDNIPVDVGQHMKKGELLLSMDRKQFEIELKDADEKIREIEASLESSEIKNYANQLEKGKIAVEQAEIAYSAALNDFNNAKTLAEWGAISKDEIDEKEDSLKSTKAMLNTAKISLQEIENNTPDSVKAVYKAKLGQAVLGKERIKLNLKRQVVLSPIDGIILEKKVDVNTIGMPGTIAFVIGSTKDIEAESYILSDDITNIKLGDEVEVIERSDKKQVIHGKVTKIAPSAVAMTSSLGVNQRKVCVTIGELDGTAALKPGYEVDVKVITERKDNIIMVPLSSVFEYKGQDCVFVLESGKAVLRAVQKGIQDEYHAEIVNGLKEGELVLPEPDNNIREGMKIKPGKSEE